MPDSIQCGPFVDLPKPQNIQNEFTHGQYCNRGGPDKVCWGRSKTYEILLWKSLNIS